MKKIRILAFFSALASALPLAAAAPPFDTSGNSNLNGTYYFRHVIYVVNLSPDQEEVVGDIGRAISLYGSIVFNGNGGYTINNGRVLDSSVGLSQTLECYLEESTNPNCTDNNGITGTYAVSASGFGYLSNPIVSGDLIYGLVAGNGIFSGSTTESTQAYNDLFIAAPLPSPVPTGFNGSSYTVVGYLPAADIAFQINPNGSGNLGSVAIGGYAEGYGTSQIAQTSNVTYAFSNGAAVLTFPTNNNAAFYAGGQIYLYFSQDGNFFFGGSPEGYDMVLGVSDNTSGDSNFGACNGGTSCLYYQTGIDQDVSQIGNTACDDGYGCANLDGYFGSFNATDSGAILSHERVSDQVFYGSTYGYTLSDSFAYPVTGSYTDNDLDVNYWIGDNGAVRIGQGIGPYLGITLGFQAPSFTPTGSVYINPTGIVNSASFAPFTAGIANGEFIAIFGNNLAPGTTVASGLPYPTTLNNVQVFINNALAPLYFVSPGQIAAIVPSGNPFSLAQIQVSNNGTLSNVVTVPVGAPGDAPVNVTSPGVFTNPSGGVYAAAVDVTANPAFIVTPSNPAQPGDTIEVFLAGLGEVYPTVPDGSAAPASPPFSDTVNTVTADVDGVDATVSFSGLAPTLAGLYQVNVTIPSTTAAGDHLLDFSVYNPSSSPTGSPTLQSYAQQVLISVGGGSAARPALEARLRRHARSRAKTTRQPFCGPGTTRTCAAPGSPKS